jgi:hypothetical protein
VIISCDYLNLSLAKEYVGDVTKNTKPDYQVQPTFSPSGSANHIAVFRSNENI